MREALHLSENRLGRRAGPVLKSSPPAFILPVAVLIFIIGGIGPNTPLALLCIAVLVFGTILLWRPGEPPILLFIFCLQWLQMSLPVFLANLAGLEVNSTSDLPAANIEEAVILSEAALATLAIGARLGAGRRKLNIVALAQEMAFLHPVRDFFRLYALSFAGAFAAETGAYIVSGLSQPLLALANIKWAFFWMLGYVTFSRPASPKLYFLAAAALEFVWGIGGYFSEFKSVFIYIILTTAAARVRLSAKMSFGLGIVVCLVLLLGVVWTKIKPEYRAFVSGGEAAQIVSVGFPERMSKLLELTSSLDGEALGEGAEALAQRVAYVGFFGAVLDYVPKVMPYEEGALWWDAVTRPFMPRLFFPEKTSIDDSVRTNKYTGLGVAEADQGTSISLGYFAESYIDFGEAGMMAPIFLLGLFYGNIYRWLLTMRRTRGLLGMGLACSTLAGAAFAESSITKVFGAVVVGTLMAWTVARYAVPVFCPWLQARPGR